MKLGTLNAYIDLGKNETIKYRFAYKSDIVHTVTRSSNSVQYDGLKTIQALFKNKSISNKDKVLQMNDILRGIGLDNLVCTDDLATFENEEQIKLGLEKLINFFTEFEFEPNFRFVNTFAYACQNMKDACSYVSNYFRLTDSAFYFPLLEKMKSPEFREIVDLLSVVEPTHKVNNRFKLYYGSAGTGKTTQAMKETGNNCMVCHSAMLPSDLMEDFKFIDGKADFQPSALQIAITDGEAIVLDEINLLPFESLRFLQSILDGKREFMYKGNCIKIADGFEIIGTMNLTVNGCTYALPEPLVDRCSEIKEYRLTAENLLGAIL